MLVFLRKPDAETNKGHQELKGHWTHVGDVAVVCFQCFLRLEKEKEPEEWRTQHIGGVPTLADDVHALRSETLEVAGEPKGGIETEGARRPTMYVASVDIKTAFGAARPKHIAILLGDQKTHGRIIASLSLQQSSLKGKADFERVEREFLLTRCFRQGSAEAPTLWLKLARHILATVC